MCHLIMRGLSAPKGQAMTLGRVSLWTSSRLPWDRLAWCGCPPGGVKAFFGGNASKKGNNASTLGSSWRPGPPPQYLTGRLAATSHSAASGRPQAVQHARLYGDALSQGE